eukprot:m.67537 g.67537  ORF g.67537 m.67537 type:complete len:1029 (+) comp13636_c1_seq1:140-3226(+)
MKASWGCWLAVSVIALSCAGRALANNTDLHPCALPACTPDSPSSCDEAYQAQISATESLQLSLEHPAEHLLQLSEGETDPSGFYSQASAVSRETQQFTQATTSTLQALELQPIADGIQQAVATHTVASTTAASLDMSAQALSATIAQTSTSLLGLRSLFTATSNSIVASRAGLCPTNVPDADNYHFSGAINATTGGYGSFQLEMGARNNDILVTLQVKPGDAPGIVLATSSSLAASSPQVPDGFVLAVTDESVVFRLACGGSVNEISTAFAPNNSVLQTIHIIRLDTSLSLRVNDDISTKAISSCRLDMSGLVHVGSPQPIVVEGQSWPSLTACIRTISMDGVLIVQEGQASSSALSRSDCLQTISDIFVLIDTSTSVSETAFQTFGEFLMHSLVPVLESSKLYARVGVAQFAGPNSYHLISTFTDDPQTLLDNYNQNFRSQAGQSFIGTALRRGAQEFDTNSMGSGNRLLLVLTDGRTTSEDLVNVPIGLEALRQLGVVTVALGIGTSLDVPALRQLAFGIEANVVQLGDAANLANIERDFINDVCVPSVPRLALFAQHGIIPCTQLGCDEYVAHSALLPDVQTYTVAENERVKRELLAQAQHADQWINNVTSSIADAVARTGIADAGFASLAAYIASSTYNDAVAALSTGVSLHAEGTQLLSVLVSTLTVTASREAAAASVADATITATLQQLRSSLTDLGSVDVASSQLLSRATSMQQEASAARASASSQLTLATNLQESVMSLGTQLSSVYGLLSTEVSTEQSRLSSAIAAADTYELPTNVSAFSQEASQLVENLNTKLELREDISLQAIELVAEHSLQRMQASQLESSLSSDTALHSTLSGMLQAGQSVLVAETSTISTLAQTVTTGLGNAQTQLSSAVSRQTSREVIAGTRVSSLETINSSLSSQIASIETTSDATSDVVDGAVSCYDSASMLLEQLDEMRSNVRNSLNSINAQAASLSTQFSGTLSSEISGLYSLQALQSSQTVAQTAQASSLAVREIDAQEATDELSTLVQSIVPECFAV